MADLLLIATIAVDRIWELDAPLRPGARLHWRRITERHGGGGMNTGTPLAVLGHRVRVAGLLRDDAQGQASLAEMRRRGLDTSLVAIVPGNSPVTDILVAPDGERTLISPPRSAVERPAPAQLQADLVYVNADRLPAATDAALAAHRCVVAQFPHRAGMAHPAHILIASRSDVPHQSAQTLFETARAHAGPGFHTLVLTNGPHPVTIIQSTGTTEIAIGTPAAAHDTTGAGDVFAAGLIDALVRGAPIADAVRSGNGLASRFLANRASG